MTHEQPTLSVPPVGADGGPPGPAADPPRSPRAVWTRAALAGGAVLALVVAANEWLGWPWLARPAERWLTQTLDHPVTLTQGQPGDFRLRLLGGLRLQASEVTVGAPEWSGKAPLFHAQDIDLAVGWRHLLGWRPGETLQLTRVQAHQLQLNLRRDQNGRSKIGRAHV